MKKEFKLSKFRRERAKGYGFVYAEKYVKEFIKRLKGGMEVTDGFKFNWFSFCKFIDKLAGDLK